MIFHQDTKMNINTGNNNYLDMEQTITTADDSSSPSLDGTDEMECQRKDYDDFDDYDSDDDDDCDDDVEEEEEEEILSPVCEEEEDNQEEIDDDIEKGISSFRKDNMITTTRTTKPSSPSLQQRTRPSHLLVRASSSNDNRSQRLQSSRRGNFNVSGLLHVEADDDDDDDDTNKNNNNNNTHNDNDRNNDDGNNNIIITSNGQKNDNNVINDDDKIIDINNTTNNNDNTTTTTNNDDDDDNNNSNSNNNNNNNNNVIDINNNTDNDENEDTNNNDNKVKFNNTTTRYDTADNNKRKQNSTNYLSNQTHDAKLVRYSKILVLFALFISAGICIYGTYLVTERNEEITFNTMFEDHGNDILTMTQTTIKNMMSTVDGMSIQITSLAIETNVTWPYVSIPHFHRKVNPIHEIVSSSLSSSSSLDHNNNNNHNNIYFATLVTKQQRIDWEEWSVRTTSSSSSVIEAIIAQDKDNNSTTISKFITKTTATMNNNNELHQQQQNEDLYYIRENRFPEEYGQKYYAPVIQNDPLNIKQLHWNIFDIKEVRESFNLLLQQQQQQSASTSTTTTSTNNNIVSPIVQLMNTKDDATTTTTTSNGILPMSYLMTSIVEDFTDITTSLSNNNDTNNVVGVLVTEIHWHQILSNMVPIGIEKLTVVIETTTTCQGRSGDNDNNNNVQMVTYDIIGPDVIYVGIGDHHDSKFDTYEISGPLIIDKNNNNNNDNNNNMTCQNEIMLRIYPTDSFRNSFQSTTKNGGFLFWYYILPIIVLFTFISTVFFVYDHFVQRRQRKVMKLAVRNSAIVSSLFPAQVRDRVLVTNNSDDYDDDDTSSSLNHHNITNNKSSIVGGTIRRRRNNGRSTKTATSSASTTTTRRQRRGGGRRQNNNDSHNTYNSNKKKMEFRKQFARQHHDAVLSLRCKSVQNLLCDGLMDSKKMNKLLLKTKPIADLFPNATVMFADICGFTAWSSVRDPTQVFTLLEQIYQSFDTIGKRRKIFKVETIGDCYVAATGLPEPRKDHAEEMARFAHECRWRMNYVVKQLEVLLGPGTADLTMRLGLHSGPVTAGVLRGEKSRFQLFGDTVNTASRIESTGKSNMIHVSKETANILIKHGKTDWIVPRDEPVEAKGKGKIQTYWLTMGHEKPRRRRSWLQSENMKSITNNIADTNVPLTRLGRHNKLLGAGYCSDERTQRLIDWTEDVLYRQLKKIIAMRDEKKTKAAKTADKLRTTNKGNNEINVAKTVLDEVTDSISLITSNDDEIPKDYVRSPDLVRLPDVVVTQLHNYVTAIAAMYRDNPFHCFEHASHVTQSVTKLMRQVITADDAIDYDDMGYNSFHQRSDDEDSDDDLDNNRKDNNNNNNNSNDDDDDDNTSSSNTASSTTSTTANKPHQYTCGITSDPLVHFACTFSALIHDVDHPGISNTQLVIEGSDLAHIYRSKSIAEQNSVDIAWDLFMEPVYADLRKCIFATQEEIDRFRQLVVNCVMATDLVDKDLNIRRTKRWENVFQNDNNKTMRTNTTGNEYVEKKSLLSKSTVTTQSNVSNHDNTNNEASSSSLTSKEDNGVDYSNKSNNIDTNNRKATMVIEHIIQASDVSHALQHWHVYQKWNERLFHEHYKAYSMRQERVTVEGRPRTTAAPSSTVTDIEDPSKNYYQSELEFFDTCVIPLAKRLKESGAFGGGSSDEYLNYAKANRAEWQHKGRHLILGYLATYQKQQQEDDEENSNNNNNNDDANSVTVDA